MIEEASPLTLSREAPSGCTPADLLEQDLAAGMIAAGSMLCNAIEI